MAKISKGFRLSEVAVKRLEELAVKWELPQAVVLEQLLKKEAEGKGGKNG